MSTCVCVLSNSGERLMPTFRLGKVRRLLKDGKAKIVKHHPFTIQLLYDSKTNTQPIEICEDVGYNYIGISVKSESHEYVSAQYDTLQDEKEQSTPAPVTKQKVKNFLTAELAVITKRVLKTCTSTAAKRCRRGVAL